MFDYKDALFPKLLALSVMFFSNGGIAQDISELPPNLVQYADFIFTNGQILTADADEDFTIAEAVAVRGNRIIAVGSEALIIQYAGPDTRRIDLKGRSMTPKR